MASTILFILIVALLLIGAAKLYGRTSGVAPPEPFLEDRMSRLMSPDLIEQVRSYADQAEQTVPEVIDEALREFLERRKGPFKADHEGH